MYPPRIDTRCNLPTPDQIAERADAIRATWTDAERYRRARWMKNGPVETLLAREVGTERKPKGSELP